MTGQIGRSPIVLRTTRQDSCSAGNHPISSVMDSYRQKSDCAH